MKFVKISINGNILDPQEAKISVLGKGYLLGMGAFETFRYSGGKIFLMSEHFARLDKSLKALNIPFVFSEEHKKQINEICKFVPAGLDGRVRFQVTAGSEQPNVIIYSSTIHKFKPEDAPAKILSSVVREKPEYFKSFGFRIKSFDYSVAEIAKKELAAGEEGILLSPEGYVAEFLRANILWAKNEKLYTPPLSLAILPGTLRDWAIKNFSIEEKLITADDLLQTDEIILTSGSRFLVAINSINGTQKPGVNGQIYKKLTTQLLKDIKDKSELLT